MTRVLVAVKRVADASGEVVLTADAQGLDGRFAGYTISEHDGCAVELAVQVAEATDGSATVATVGLPEAEEQLRGALALGVREAVLVETDPGALGPVDVARQLAAVVSDAEAEGAPYDLVLLGNDAADTGDFQVPIRLAYELGRPVVTGARVVGIAEGRVAAWVQGPGGQETYDVPPPAVVSVLAGGVEPRYPSLRGRMAAKKVEVDVRKPVGEPVGADRVRWEVPTVVAGQTDILGEGSSAAPAMVDVLEKLGVLR